MTSCPNLPTVLDTWPSERGTYVPRLIEPITKSCLEDLKLYPDISGCIGHSEEATSESNGDFRFRGLQPNCEYLLRLQGEKQNIEKLMPGSNPFFVFSFNSSSLLGWSETADVLSHSYGFENQLLKKRFAANQEVTGLNPAWFWSFSSTFLHWVFLY